MSETYERGRGPAAAARLAGPRRAGDAVREALFAAAGQWPQQGVPDNPRGWLIGVASRRLVDRPRSDDARRAREETVATLAPRADEPGGSRAPSDDGTLTLKGYKERQTASIGRQQLRGR